jgi:hypothetical protein
MRTFSLSLALLTVVTLVSTTSIHGGGPKGGPKRESIVGTIIAYDHLNNLMYLTDVPSRVVFIARTQPRGHDKGHFIQVNYTYWSSRRADEGGFPDELIANAHQWRFKLIGVASCDRPLKEFASLQDATTGKDTEVSIPIWKIIPGAENEKIPFGGETLPCYSLKAGGYKPYRNR